MRVPLGSQSNPGLPLLPVTLCCLPALWEVGGGRLRPRGAGPGFPSGPCAWLPGFAHVRVLLSGGPVRELMNYGADVSLPGVPSHLRRFGGSESYPGQVFWLPWPPAGFLPMPWPAPAICRVSRCSDPGGPCDCWCPGPSRLAGLWLLLLGPRPVT